MDTWTGPQVHWKDVLPRANEKEILARFFKGDSQRTIAAALRVSSNTVDKVVKASREQQLEAAALDCIDSETLHRHLLPEDVSLLVQVQPDYEMLLSCAI